MSKRATVFAVWAAILMAAFAGPAYASRAGQNCKNGKAANCYANFFALGFDVPVQFDLRGGGAAALISQTATTATYEWFGNTLYQDHPLLGRMYVTLSDGTTSTATAVSDAPDGQPFFPAQVEARLFVTIALIDMGKEFFTLEPLVLTGTLDNFFLTGEALVLQEDVTFYDSAAPSEPAGFLGAGSVVTNYPPVGLEVERVRCSVEEDLITIEWAVRNLTAEPLEASWVVDTTAGIVDVTPARDVEALQPAPASTSVQATATLADSTTRQEMVLQVSGTGGELAYAYHPTLFDDGACSPDRVSVEKSFADSRIPVGGTTTVTIDLANPNTVPLSELTFFDVLPPGLEAEIPQGPEQCGGVVGVSEEGEIVFSGGTLAAAGSAGSSCQVRFDVRGVSAGLQTNPVVRVSAQPGIPDGLSRATSLQVGTSVLEIPLLAGWGLAILGSLLAAGALYVLLQRGS